MQRVPHMPEYPDGLSGHRIRQLRPPAGVRPEQRFQPTPLIPVPRPQPIRPGGPRGHGADDADDRGHQSDLFGQQHVLHSGFVQRVQEGGEKGDGLRVGPDLLYETGEFGAGVADLEIDSALLIPFVDFQTNLSVFTFLANGNPVSNWQRRGGRTGTSRRWRRFKWLPDRISRCCAAACFCAAADRPPGRRRLWLRRLAAFLSVLFLAVLSGNIGELFDLGLKRLGKLNDLLADVDLESVVQNAVKVHHDAREFGLLVVRLPHLVPAAPFNQSVVAIDEQALCISSAFPCRPIRSSALRTASGPWALWYS